MAPTDPQPALRLPATEPGSSAVINDHCLLRAEGELCAVGVSGVVLSHFRADDRMARAHSMVTLVEQGIADQNDAARALGCSTRTLRRYRRRYEERGMVGLGARLGLPRDGPSLDSLPVEKRARVHPTRQRGSAGPA